MASPNRSSAVRKRRTSRLCRVSRSLLARAPQAELLDLLVERRRPPRPGAPAAGPGPRRSSTAARPRPSRPGGRCRRAGCGTSRQAWWRRARRSSVASVRARSRSPPAAAAAARRARARRPPPPGARPPPPADSAHEVDTHAAAGDRHQLGHDLGGQQHEHGRRRRLLHGLQQVAGRLVLHVLATVGHDDLAPALDRGERGVADDPLGVALAEGVALGLDHPQVRVLLGQRQPDVALAGGVAAAAVWPWRPGGGRRTGARRRTPGPARACPSPAGPPAGRRAPGRGRRRRAGGWRRPGRPRRATGRRSRRGLGRGSGAAHAGQSRVPRSARPIRRVRHDPDGSATRGATRSSATGATGQAARSGRRVVTASHTAASTSSAEPMPSIVTQRSASALASAR